MEFCFGSILADHDEAEDIENVLLLTLASMIHQSDETMGFFACLGRLCVKDCFDFWRLRANARLCEKKAKIFNPFACSPCRFQGIDWES